MPFRGRLPHSTRRRPVYDGREQRPATIARAGTALGKSIGLPCRPPFPAVERSKVTDGYGFGLGMGMGSPHLQRRFHILADVSENSTAVLVGQQFGHRQHNCHRELE